MKPKDELYAIFTLTVNMKDRINKMNSDIDEIRKRVKRLEGLI